MSIELFKEIIKTQTGPIVYVDRPLFLSHVERWGKFLSDENFHENEEQKINLLRKERNELVKDLKGWQCKMDQKTAEDQVKDLRERLDKSEKRSEELFVALKRKAIFSKKNMKRLKAMEEILKAIKKSSNL